MQSDRDKGIILDIYTYLLELFCFSVVWILSMEDIQNVVYSEQRLWVVGGGGGNVVRHSLFLTD